MFKNTSRTAHLFKHSKVTEVILCVISTSLEPSKTLRNTLSKSILVMEQRGNPVDSNSTRCTSQVLSDTAGTRPLAFVRSNNGRPLIALPRAGGAREAIDPCWRSDVHLLQHLQLLTVVVENHRELRLQVLGRKGRRRRSGQRKIQVIPTWTRPSSTGENGT